MKRNTRAWLVSVCAWVAAIDWNEICRSLVISWFWVAFILWLGISYFHERIFAFVYMFELCHTWVTMFLISSIFVLISVLHKNIHLSTCVSVCLTLKLTSYLSRTYWLCCQWTGIYPHCILSAFEVNLFSLWILPILTLLFLLSDFRTFQNTILPNFSCWFQNCKCRCFSDNVFILSGFYSLVVSEDIVS